QCPAAVLALGALDYVHCVGEARVARRADGLEIVESAEDVVVPSWWEREANEYRLDNFAGAVRAKEPVHQKELTAATLRGPHRPHFASTASFVVAQALKDTDRRMDRSVGRTVRALAIPATVRHLLLQQVVGNGVQTVVVVFEVRESGKDHPRDARFALTCP